MACETSARMAVPTTRGADVGEYGGLIVCFFHALGRMFELPLLLTVCCLYFTHVQKNACDAGIVDGLLGFNGQLGVFPDAGGQSPQRRCSLADALVDLGVE